MADVKVSKDGQNYFEIPDSEVGEAQEKGYSSYYDVSKDGATYATIPGDDLQEAVGKGYKLKSVWDAQSQVMNPVSKGAVDVTMGGVEKVGKALDYVAGAPTRAALYEIVKPQTESRPVGRWIDAAKSFAGQYLKSPAEAPTEKDIGGSLGFSQKESIKIPIPFYTSQGGFQVDDMSVSPAGLAGGLLGSIADPTNYLGIGGSLGMAAKGTRQGVGGVVKGAAKVAKVADESAALGKILKELPALESGVKTVANAENLGQRIASGPIIKTTVAPDFPELAKIAKEFDIPVDQLPARVEFGPKSTATLLEQARMDSPMGEGLRVKHDGIVQKTRDAVESLNERIGGGAVLNRSEAGEMIREGYRSKIIKEMADQENSYATLADPERLGTVPVAADKSGMTDVIAKWRDKVYRESLENVRDPDTGLVIQRPSARGVAILDNLDGAAQAENLDELFKQIKIVGNQAFADPRAFGVQIDQRAMRELYGDLREAFTKTVETVDPAQAERLTAHNARMTKTLNDRKVFENVVENIDKDPEAVFKYFTANTNRIERAKELLSPEQFNAMKSAAVSSLFTSTANEPWTFAGLNRAIEKNRKTLSALLNPDELKSLENLTTLGNRMGPSTLNPSGTEVLRGYKEFVDKPVRTILASKTMQSAGDRLAQGARLDAAGKGMAVEGSKLPGYVPQGFTSTLDQTVAQGPLRNPLSSMTAGERAADLLGKSGLYAKKKYQRAQEEENEQNRDYSASDKIQMLATQNPAALGKFATPLQEAMQRGGNSFAVTHFLLQQQDAEYRMMLKDMDEK
jgi:hypothetical protein